jgi:hypothetical protein
MCPHTNPLCMCSHTNRDSDEQGKDVGRRELEQCPASACVGRECSCRYTRTTSTKAARAHTDEMKADAGEEHVQAASEASHVSLTHVSLTHVSGTHVSGTRQQSQRRHSFPKADAREEHVQQVQQRSPAQRTHKGALRSGAAGCSGGGEGGWGGRSRSGVGRNESLLMSAAQALVHLSSMNFDLALPPPPERDTPRSPREPVDAEVDAEVRD